MLACLSLCWVCWRTSTCCCLTLNSSVPRWSNEPWTCKNKHVGPILRLLPFPFNKPKNEGLLLGFLPDYGPHHPWPAGFQSVQDPQSPAGPPLTLLSHVCRSQLQRTRDKNRIPVFLKPSRSKQWDGILLQCNLETKNKIFNWIQGPNANQKLLPQLLFLALGQPTRNLSLKRCKLAALCSPDISSHWALVTPDLFWVQQRTITLASG